MGATGNAERVPTPVDILQAEEKSRKDPNDHHEKDPSEIDKTRVVWQRRLPLALPVMAPPRQTSRRIAYRLEWIYCKLPSFTTIVAVRLAGTFSSFDVGQRRRSDKINTPINEVPLPSSSRITCLGRFFTFWIAVSMCMFMMFVTFHRSMGMYQVLADKKCLRGQNMGAPE